MANQKRESVPNVALYNLRDELGQSQDDVARALTDLSVSHGKPASVTANQVSRWERGVVHPSPFYRQLLAEHFKVTVSELGLTRQKLTSANNPNDGTSYSFDVSSIGEQAQDESPDVLKSRDEWLATRKQIAAQHDALTRLAASLYPENVQLGEDGLIARPDWIFPAPVELSNISVVSLPDVPPPAIDGTEDSSRHLRPLRTASTRFQRYSHAIRDVAKPRLFENRLSWRLVNVDFTQAEGKLAFGLMNYFDAMDTCEAVAHETAAVHVRNNQPLPKPTWRGLTFRKAIGDPFDLERRSVIMSINTLTIRLDKSGAASVILHNRSAANVATSGGVVGVMPAGVFQPSTVRPGSYDGDFDLWRNIMREYSEEFLGNPEHSGDGPAADYTQSPFSELDKARKAGRVRVYGVGVGLGALDLWAALETIAVFEADTFDEIFANMVDVNDEGTVVRVGQHQPTVHVPFTAEVIRDLEASGRLAPETAFSLTTAWKHRDLLLSRPSGF